MIVEIDEEFTILKLLFLFVGTIYLNCGVHVRMGDYEILIVHERKLVYEVI